MSDAVINCLRRKKRNARHDRSLLSVPCEDEGEGEGEGEDEGDSEGEGEREGEDEGQGEVVSSK